jgi:hypothetical protein
MRNIAYLTRSNRTASEDLFVSNNTLPFCWLMLISEKDLEQADFNDPGILPVIRVSRQTAITNGLTAIPFMEECFPERLKLFRDFIAYLDKNLQPDDDLVLDIFSLAPEEDIETFLHHLREELQAIEMYDIEKIEGAYNNNDIPSLVGYGHFPGNDITLYEQTFRPSDALSLIEEKIPEGPSLTAAIAIILAGMIMLYVPWQGFRNDDINLAVASCLIISFSVLVYGCRQLLSAFRNRAVKKTFQS